MKKINTNTTAAFTQHINRLVATTVLSAIPLFAWAAPVPGYVPPVKTVTTPEYADDTRGVYVPQHQQHRLQTENELYSWGGRNPSTPSAAQQQYNLNRLSDGAGNMAQELNRIAQDPGLLQGGTRTSDAGQYARLPQRQLAQNFNAQPYVGEYPAAKPMSAQAPYAPQTPVNRVTTDGGLEIAAGQVKAASSLDMHNSLVRLQEERISVRRALQRMMDQIGGGDWTLVWDLAEQNMSLPEMEISIYAEEPFMNVLNALLARIQTRSGQPLRVIKYDQTSRLVITDRAGGYNSNKAASTVSGGVGVNAAVTERVLKEARVSLHYDEVPLVDALENLISQAGKGQWRLRMYAGTDQVLKPAHIEEPFNVAMDRLLKLFNLKYEIFPGGKLIVVTFSDRFGFKGGVNQ